MVVYDPLVVPTYDVLKVFWENHDPTQGFRQGNDIGTQYRSALYWTTDEQAELVERTRASYDALLRQKGYGEVTTELAPAEGLPFYYAEANHQQYSRTRSRRLRLPCRDRSGVAAPVSRLTAAPYPTWGRGPFVALRPINIRHSRSVHPRLQVGRRRVATDMIWRWARTEHDESWAAAQDTPWGRLRYRVMSENLTDMSGWSRRPSLRYWT